MQSTLDVINDLLFEIDIKDEMLRDEKIRYYVYGLYYYKKINNLMDISNFRYLSTKISNLLLSVNQLLYETDLEHMYWESVKKILSHPNGVYILNDIYDDLENNIIDFSNYALMRLEYFDFYYDRFNNFLSNGVYLDDEYFLSDLKEEDYINKIKSYEKKLELINTK